MASCSEMPEVSLMHLDEDVIKIERMVDQNVVSEHSILSKQSSNTPDIQIDSIHGVHIKHIPDIHNKPSQTFEGVPLSSEYTKAANCDKIIAPKTGSQHPDSFGQVGILQKSVLDRAPEQIHDFADSDKEHTTVHDKSIDITKIHSRNIENSEYEAARNTSNSAVSVGPSNESLVLGAERSNVESAISGALSKACFKDNTDNPAVSIDFRASTSCLEGYIQAKEFVKIVPELDSPSGNRTLNSGELTNQLIEGPRIILPPSQLPVIQSYPIQSYPSHLHNQEQSACSDSFIYGTSDLQLNTYNSNNITYAEALRHNPHSNTSKTIQIDNNAETLSAQNAAAQNASQRESTSAGLESKAKVTEAGLSNHEQTTSTVYTEDTAAKSKAKRTPNDFIFGKVIGEGSYSTVYLAKEVSTQREFAIKVCDKKHLIRERKTHFVMREKEVLMKLDHPFFIKLAYTFQDSERLYYVLTYARNGELLAYLHKLSAFDVPCTRFYSAEIVLALEYLHGLGIIHRDLKPENILISEDMHIRITDFGTSKILSLDSDGKAESQADAKRKNSFVGTAEYVSPEVLNNQPANFGSDLWALGCIIYQCLSGSLPFRSGNEYQTFQKIVKAEYEFPEGFNPDAKDLVQKLLVLDPSTRLGMVKPDGMKALKNHSFYVDINWETLPEDTPPKLMPYLPATANNPEFWGQEQRTGFDDQRLAEIITGQSADGSMSPELEEVPIKMLSQVEDDDRLEKLRKQRLENQFHQFVKDNLIIKQGFVDKRKGLFARKRMLLLTEGPHLYYVDAHNKVLKGEIPWSKYLRPEAKNFKIFFVHTPNRTYYLESRQPDAQSWVAQIKEVWKKYYDNGKDK